MTRKLNQLLVELERKTVARRVTMRRIERERFTRGAPLVLLGSEITVRLTDDE